MRPHFRTIKTLILTAALCAGGSALRAAEAISYDHEVLANGLRVIYAPMPESPVVHVRVLYNVGSRNERPDRQGFAHMFEHMMFRGSAHVAPEEHMKLLGQVGGSSNAFTSFDQTVYVNTVPASQLELPLFLEADRMASFKVSDDIFSTERNVVAQEARMREAQPFGRMADTFNRLAYDVHSYRWLPIGNMQHLQNASTKDLQQFFNTYYVPNNAILVIAGNIKVADTKAAVQKYFGWIPRGKDPVVNVPAEPKQAAARRAEVVQSVPLTAVQIGWHVPAYASKDRPALSLLSTILGGGRSASLQRLLVSGSQPTCNRVSFYTGQNQDPTLLAVTAMLLKGSDPADVESTINTAIAEIVEKGVPEAELAKAKTMHRVGMIQGRQTAEQVATQLGVEALFARDPERVNTALARLDAVTPDDIQRVAGQYLRGENSVTLIVRPGKTPAAAKPEEKLPADLVDVTANVPTREITFPASWPQHPPISTALQAASFKRGQEALVNGIKVIAIEDRTLPIVSWNLTILGGSDAEPDGKQGLGAMTSILLRRGAGEFSYTALNDELESRGIQLEVADAGDSTKISGTATTDQLDYAIARTADVLHRPRFSTAEFARIKTQMVNQLRVSMEDPADIASRELAAAVYGNTVMGRAPTMGSVSNLTLNDVRKFYSTIYRPEGAYLIFAGDINLDRAKSLAQQILSGWEPGAPPAVDYTNNADASKTHIVIVDNPDAKQATIRMAAPAYTNKNPQKYAGFITGQILSRGIESRLGRYVRAEKGLAYNVKGSFSPGRHGGLFESGTETAAESAAAAVEAMFKVFNTMADELVTDEELSQAKTRVAGSMVLSVQTLAQQASFRSAEILNGYEDNYYEKYVSRVAEVTPPQVRDVMKQYVRKDKMVIVVVGPAAKMKDSLSAIGPVDVVPMPAKRVINETE